ncbi:MAG: sulfur transferase domain-containing protein [Planctomycetota bacterium]
MKRRLAPLFLGLVMAAGVGHRPAVADAGPAGESIAAPLEGFSNPYDAAAQLELRESKPAVDAKNLHNVYRLSRNIVTGGEPLDQAALKTVADMGVKTILSVDGKVPDQEAAKKLGMRYVHVPVRYTGLTREQLLQIAKTFRELEGPFYVHCFHGKHRGPAGAAVGRLIVDSASREQALAEMRQWCGTSGKYTELYKLIASGAIPTAAETAAYKWEFPAAHPISGVRHAMVGLTRHFDNLREFGKRDFAADPAHPDLDPVNEAEKFAGLMKNVGDQHESKARPNDYREWMATSIEESRALVDFLKKAKAGDDAAAPMAKKTVRVLLQNCTSCHAVYRN